tara:strand:- start:8110 stop:8676 length:567 start_codon:yes stop_codon:yes gene_type:complete
MDQAMNDEVNFKNNPLHGLSLKNLLIELVDHYGFEILDAYLNINCFKINPSIESSVKFLKKTDWAREKVEILYLYEYKNLPRASSEQFALPPRDRIIPDHHVPGEPALLSLEDAERLQEKRAKKAAEHSQNSGYRSGSGSGRRTDSQRSGAYSDNQERKQTRNEDRVSSKPSSDSAKQSSDPWAKWKE